MPGSNKSEAPIWLKAIPLLIWGACGVAVFVVLLSSFSNLTRRIGVESVATAEHYGACGDLGECLEFSADVKDHIALQRGAKLYTENCLGCHTLKHIRHEKIAEGLKIPESVYTANLLPANSSFAGHVKNALPKELSKEWFGVQPPDLTLATRARSPQWIYSYLKSFYVSDDRPFGYDNLTFPAVGMPNVMERLQGVQRLTCDGDDPTHCTELTVDAETGVLDAEEFDQAVGDLTNFLVYVAEPYATERKELGVYVILFLVVLSSLLYLTQREFNRDYK